MKIRDHRGEKKFTQCIGEKEQYKSNFSRHPKQQNAAHTKALCQDTNQPQTKGVEVGAEKEETARKKDSESRYAWDARCESHGTAAGDILQTKNLTSLFKIAINKIDGVRQKTNLPSFTSQRNIRTAKKGS